MPAEPTQEETLDLDAIQALWESRDRPGGTHARGHVLALVMELRRTRRSFQVACDEIREVTALWRERGAVIDALKAEVASLRHDITLLTGPR